MHSVWFGEFLGTLVLILFGNGVCAGVTLRKSYAADAGWLAITTGWALGVLCGVLVAQAFGSPGANLNPAITLAVAVNSGNYSMVLSMWSAQLLGAMAGAALMALHYGPHWKLTPDPAAKLGVFCTNAAVRNPLINISQRGDRHGCAGRRRRRHRLPRRFRTVPPPPWAVAGGQPGVGHRAFARRRHWLRHQPRARPGPAPRSLAVAHSRQRRLELGLCANSNCRGPPGRRVGGGAAALRTSLIFGLYQLTTVTAKGASTILFAPGFIWRAGPLPDSTSTVSTDADSEPGTPTSTARSRLLTSSSLRPAASQRPGPQGPSPSRRARLHHRVARVEGILDELQHPEARVRPVVSQFIMLTLGNCVG